MTGAGCSLFGHYFCFSKVLIIIVFAFRVGCLEVDWALRDLHQLILVDGDLLGFTAAHVVLQDVIPVKALAALVALIRSVKKY